MFPPHPLIVTVLLVALVWLTGPAGAMAQSSDPSYLSQLVTRAKEQRLSEQRYWHVLLHYHRGLWGVTSEQDDPGFFLSPDGKTDPQAELEATLAQFFSADLVGRSRQPAQCAFVGRYEWLKEQLGFDDTRLQPQPCERFHNWLRELNTEGVTVIFPSAFMNNPASMFGHTLLRLDQKGQTDQTRILAYTVNYAADVPPDEGVWFAVKGVSGFYKGFFSTIPYYLKVKEYRDLENRDIWEYRLNFTPAQVRRMLAHAWELGNSYFDYFFFKENCSYHILSLLEAADPNMRLQDKFFLWTMPADTIRLLGQQSASIERPIYRPARSTQIRQKRAALTSEERAWLDRLTSDAATTASPGFASLPAERRALLLDIASDLLLYQSVKNSDEAPTYRDRNLALLSVRSGIKARAPIIPIKPISASPDQGHKTSRAGVAVGWRENDVFEEVSLRLAYHDLLDPATGYIPDAQIEVFGASVRHYERNNQTRLERFTLANIISLSPMDGIFHSPSWKINAGMQTVRGHRDDSGCRYCSVGVINGGPGAAVEGHVFRREVYFAFAEAEVAVGGVYDQDYRVGGGASVGMLADLTDRWKMLVTAAYLRFPLGEHADDVRFSFGQRYTITSNLALRAEFNHRDSDNEALFTVHAFF